MTHETNMKTTILLFTAVVLASQSAGVSIASQITLETAPPVVVRTVPVAGSVDVDPALSEIRVTYSKAMHDGSWSWSTWGENNFPENTGTPRYLADGRTCVLPVKLQPDKFYAIWLNSDKFKNFKDAGQRPAVPYLLTFFTGGASADSAPARTTSGSGPAGWLREAGIDLDKVSLETAPMTQVMIEDVQMNGTIRFRNVIRGVNRGTEPQDKLQFINSDIVQLQRLVDAEGNSIPSTAVHKDRIFRYSATLPKPVAPGGTLLYGSEGITRNKVQAGAEPGTFSYRFTHTPGANLPVRRVEVHRLPPGAELLEFSSNATKREADGRVEVVLDQIVEPSGHVTLEYHYRVPDAEKIVQDAVTTISRSAEGDPRVQAALNTLEPLDQSQVIAALLPHLDAKEDTVRRSAIYILWKGGFTNIAAAVPRLEKLMAHKEEFTRGMAALALGEHRVAESFERLGAMTKNDPSGYARRCAAYALGLLGDARAEPILESALKDPEAMVRSNAKAALGMLKAAKASPAPAPKGTDGGAHERTFKAVVETILKSPEGGGRVAELLDLDTGRRATNASFGDNDRETHAWVREHKLDLLGVIEKGEFGVLCMDMVVPPAPNNSFDQLTPQQVLTNWCLAQGEPNKITALVQEKTDTFFFRTREGGQGVLQVIGEVEEPRGVKIRYKLVEPAADAGGDDGARKGAETRTLPKHSTSTIKSF
jgi:hypothetical protein